MIAYLSGRVLVADIDGLIVETNGVGYRVGVPGKKLLNFRAGQKLELYIHTHVREDALTLFGFTTASDLRLFERLISVSGIGPKTALSIFNAGETEDIISAIVDGRVEFFTAVSGIGKKNAMRLVLELKTKLGGDDSMNFEEADDELIEGLVGFGFSRKEAVVAAKGIDRKLPDEEKLKLALRGLGSKK